MSRKRQKHRKLKAKNEFKIPKVDLFRVKVFKKDMNTNLLILIAVFFICFSLLSVWYAFSISKVKNESYKKSEEIRKLIENALEERDRQIEMANDKSFTIKQNYETLYYDILMEYKRVKSQCGS